LKFSIVIPTHSEGLNLLETVTDIVEHSHGSDFEVIVTDDCSDDFSWFDIEDTDQVHVVFNPERLGVAGTRNNGAKYADGDVLIFIDAHSRVPAGWLETIEKETDVIRMSGREPFGRMLYGPVLGALGREDDTDELFTAGHAYRSPSLEFSFPPLKRSRYPYPVMLVPGGCQIIGREYFWTLGGFDTGLRPPFGQEDHELSLRVWMTGGECRLIPQLTIRTLFRDEHPYGGVNWRNILFNEFRMARMYFGEERFVKVVLDKLMDPGLQPEAVKALAEVLKPNASFDARSGALPFRLTADDIFGKMFPGEW
jgi:glycosyltransferase involved in cell wall biosynthesis